MISAEELIADHYKNVFVDMLSEFSSEPTASKRFSQDPDHARSDKLHQSGSPSDLPPTILDRGRVFIV